MAARTRRRREIGAARTWRGNLEEKIKTDSAEMVVSRLYFEENEKKN